MLAHVHSTTNAGRDLECLWLPEGAKVCKRVCAKHFATCRTHSHLDGMVLCDLTFRMTLFTVNAARVPLGAAGATWACRLMIGGGVP